MPTSGHRGPLGAGSGLGVKRQAYDYSIQCDRRTEAAAKINEIRLVDSVNNALGIDISTGNDGQHYADYVRTYNAGMNDTFTRGQIRLLDQLGTQFGGWEHPNDPSSASGGSSRTYQQTWQNSAASHVRRAWYAPNGGFNYWQRKIDRVQSQLDSRVGQKVQAPAAFAAPGPECRHRMSALTPARFAEHHMHQGRYNALQLINASVDTDGQITMAEDVSSARDLGNRAIPTEGANPAHPNQSFATGINIHHAGINDFTGVTRTGTGVSEGCQVVATHEWDSFMNIVAARTNGRYNVPYFNTWIVRGH